MFNGLKQQQPAANGRTNILIRGVVGALILLAAGTLAAQSVPTGVQEYFVLGWERHIWDMMDEVQNAQGGAQFATAMNSVVTATASADNQVIYFDHWEDGLDPELDNFPGIDPLMLQASTLVIGDGDITNGDVCTFNANIGCGTDLLAAGDYVNFNSDQGLASAVCASLPAEPEKCSVPLNPRNPSEIHYDGGDLILTSGGPLSVIHSQYPLTNFIGGSTEILSRQAVEAARSYSVPIGEDLYVANTVTEPFHYVHLNLVAFADTSITVDSPGVGSVSFSLGRGEHWSSQGYIDATTQPTLALQINAGTKVSTTAPIAGMVFTGGDATWATRHYALLPDILHSTDYVTTAPGDDPTVGPTTNGTSQNRPANIYILNPDQLTAIDVDIIDSSGSYTVNIPANSMRSMDDLGPPRDIAPNSTVRMTSDRNFWGVTAYDYNTHVSDWGHSWLAKKFLTNFYTVSFGPGNQIQPPDTSQFSNPVFVAATVDRTRVQFDLENDGVFDLVDLDGDGVGDAAPFPGNTYGVDMLSALKVIDPGDNDLTGARIFANKPIAVSWGQDTDRAYLSDNSLDTGFTIYPVNQLFLDPVLTIDKTADTTVVPLDPADPDDRIVTYTVTVNSYDFGPLTDGKIFDLLPTGVAGADYLTGTTRITYPNLVQDTVDPSATLQPSGRWLLEWPLTSDPPWASGDPPFSYGTDETLTVEYQVRIPALPGGPPRVLLNEARAEATLGGSVFTPTDLYTLVQTDVEISKTVDSSTTVPDGVLTFTITVTNNGSTTENNVFVTDAIPADTTYCDATIDPVNCSDPTGTAPFDSGTFYAAQNAIEWTAPFLTSAQSATLTFQVKVNPTTVAGTLIPNRAGYESDETPYFLSNLVEPVVEGPILAAVKSIVGNPSFVHPYEVVTFDVMVENSGSAAANNLRIFDPFPINATYVPGSIQWSRNSGPFVALTDADDGDEGDGAEAILNASNIEFRLATLGVAEDMTLRFRATVDPGTAGQFVFNQALFASDEIPSTDTNAVQVPIVGNAQINGHVFLDVNGNMVQDGGEPDIPNVDVEVTSLSRQTYSCAPGAIIPDNGYNGTIGSMACCNIAVPAGDFGAAPFITDLNIDMSAIHTYVGDLTIKVAAPGGQILAMLNRPGSAVADDGTDTPYGDSSNWSTDTITFDDQGGGPLAETMGSTIGGGTSICSGDGICNYLPAPDTAGGLLNLAGYNGLDPRGTWQVCMGDSAGGDVGTFLSSTLSFLTNESTSTTQIVTTDANGDYTAVVNSASATLDVDESDPDFPPGAVLTTANDPQTIATVPGGTAIAPDVGYQQPQIIFVKSSDPVNHQVSPGQIITYTLDITNNTGTTQTGITVTDAVPTGTSYVAGSSRVALPAATASVRVATGDDDAEENAGSGAVNLGSSDVEFVFDGGTQQIVGMRFTGVAIAPGATVSAAEIEFEVDEADSGTTNVVIYGQNSDTTSIFTATPSDISSRPSTTNTVAWSPPPWTIISQKQVTPDISSIIQEIVNRPGWASGNSIVLMIQAGPGCNSTACQRTAESYNGEAANAPLLRISTQTTAAAGDLPNLLTGSEGYTLASGATMTLTFQVIVDDPLAGGITQIVNNATLTTIEQPGPWFASVTEDVVRAGVVVEYDNAGFDLLGATVTYAHDIRNTGEGDDSYDITMTSQEGWPVDLIDPGTGAVIASDADGDGDWDGGVTINTGTLPPGGIVQYQLRVTIPLTASVGDTESTGLIATSGRNPGLWDIGTDETIAIDSLDPIIFLPDNSGVATAGGKAVYAHRVINNTGVPETFNLLAARDPSAPSWTTTYHWDSNGDGVYTDGVDIAITNTAQLAQGASQLVFVVIEVPSGTADYTIDVVHLTAAAQSDPDNKFDTSSDTTTVRPPVVLDLSGGGTRNLIGGATGVFPGTLRNFTDSADVINFDITESWFYGFDIYNHPTELWIDTNSDGTPDLEIAEDTDGDGTWDTIAPGYDTDTNNQPDVLVGADSNLAYELRRDVDPSQGPARDPVTLTVFSTNSTDQDSITATNFVAAATRAVYASVDAFAVNGQVVVEWRTAAEVGTIGFDVLRRREHEESFSKVNGGLIRSAGAIQGGTYSVIDRGAEEGETLTYIIQERDVWGSGTQSEPLTVTISERHAGAKAAEALALGVSRAANTSSIRRTYAIKAAAKSAGTPSGMIKILVREEGLVWLPAEQLADAFGVTSSEVSAWIGQGELRIGTGGGAVGEDLFMIFEDGFETGNTSRWVSPAKNIEVSGIAWVAAESDSGIYFFGEAIDSIYSNDNVYWLEHAEGSVMARREAWADPPPIVGTFTNTIHFENDNWPLTSVISDPEADYWFWDYFFPYDGEPSVSKSFTLAAPTAVATAGEARLRLHLQGSFESEVPQNHRFEVRLNGTQLGGTMTFDGHDAHNVELVFSQSLLQDGDNNVEVTALLAPGLDFDEFYLDAIELDYLSRYEARDDRLLASANGDPQITVGGFSSSDITVFDLSDPQQPVVLDPVHVYSASGDYLVSFSTGGSAFPFLAATAAASAQPEGLVVDLASSLAENNNLGRYVVVAGPGLEAEAGLLADYRAAQGLTTVVARTADIYDEFNGGLKSPWAIRDFLHRAATHWQEPPEFVLLAGDGSLDHKGVWGDGEDLVPALMAVTADGLVPSDNLLADWVGGDGVPEVAIGRLPAQSAGELAAYRGKIAVFESSDGGWKRHALWLADDEDLGGPFTDDVDDLISVLGPSFTTTRLSLEQYDVVEAWDLALETMGKGAALVNFLGHGGFDRLTEEGLVVTDKAMAMTNADRTPFLTALTCVVGRFDVPGYDTLSEALMLNSGGGAVAVWSPSAYSMNEDARFLGELHAQTIADGGVTTIGQSVREALAAYAAEATGDETLPSKFILLGDPATRVDW